jgi:hypothetical protein
MVTMMMMPLSPRRNWVLRPERAIQEMTTGERRASHTGYRRNARAKWRRVRARSSHAEREHTIEHFFFFTQLHQIYFLMEKKKEEVTRTGGDECLGGRLAHEVREREWGTDALERAEVPEDHRRLAWPEAEDGLVSLPPLFV